MQSEVEPSRLEVEPSRIEFSASRPAPNCTRREELTDGVSTDETVSVSFVWPAQLWVMKLGMGGRMLLSAIGTFEIDILGASFPLSAASLVVSCAGGVGGGDGG